MVLINRPSSEEETRENLTANAARCRQYPANHTLVIHERLPVRPRHEDGFSGPTIGEIHDDVQEAHTGAIGAHDGFRNFAFALRRFSLPCVRAIVSEARYWHRPLLQPFSYGAPVIALRSDARAAESAFPCRSTAVAFVFRAAQKVALLHTPRLNRATLPELQRVRAATPVGQGSNQRRDDRDNAQNK